LLFCHHRAMAGDAADGGLVAEFLASTSRGPSGLIIEGESGIGKTRLWRNALERARELGYQVLAARADPAESGLAYAVVAELLGDLDPMVFGDLPEVQRLAIDRVLLNGDGRGPTTNHRVAGAAVLATVERLARSRPVVIAVDDVQWLDVSSRDVLSYVARRVAGAVGIIVTHRTEPTESPGTAWLELSRPEATRRYRVPPLSLGGLHAMFSEQLGASFPRPTLVRIAETSGGNPLYALELARAISEHGADGEPTMPASLVDVVRRRIAGVEGRGFDVLLAAASVGAPTVDLLARATGIAVDDVVDLLDAAHARGIVEIEGNRVRFTHPLLARGVYIEAGAPRRREMHRRLAGVLTQAELKARHFALAATDHDDTTLSALDAAATAARARGAPAAAAEYLELALRLGGDTDSRRVDAARDYFTAGDSQRAEALLSTVLPRLPRGRLRAVASMQLAAIVIDDNHFQRAVDLLRDSLPDAAGDTTLEVHSRLWLSIAHSTLAQYEPSWVCADDAVAVAERSGRQDLISQALAVRVFTGAMSGRGVDDTDVERALRLEDLDADAPLVFRATAAAALVWAWTGRLDDAHDRMTTLRQHCVDRGADRDLLVVADHGALLHLWRGQFDRAAELAADIVERAEQVGGDHMRVMALGVRAVVAAYTGHEAQVRADVHLAFDRAAHAENPRMVLWPLTVLVFLEVSLGNHQQAVDLVEPLLREYRATPGTEIITAWFYPDVVEALIAVDRVDEALPLVTALETNGRRLDRPWMLAVGGRCRAMTLAARGDVDGAMAAVTGALRQHDRLAMPFERARTALLLGELHRRQRRRDAATATLSEALAVFDGLGAAIWADRARTELARLSPRTTSQRLLTATEQRVAELAAAGKTNRDIAAELFVSTKTVEATLGRVYRKLGVRGRVALGRRMAEIRSDT
jgi:DNA-binding CsgD family transcriptional regulator